MQDNTTVLLRESIAEFKGITEELISAINNDLSEELDRLFIERQKVINDIEKLKYDKEDFISCCNELNVLSISEVLDELVENKRIELKEKMRQLSDQKTAHRSYAQNSNTKKSFFSTKI